MDLSGRGAEKLLSLCVLIPVLVVSCFLEEFIPPEHEGLVYQIDEVDLEEPGIAVVGVILDNVTDSDEDIFLPFELNDIQVEIELINTNDQSFYGWTTPAVDIPIGASRYVVAEIEYTGSYSNARVISIR